MKDATLCFVFNKEKVLLQKKAPGLFGAGKWNAPGGKIKRLETPEAAAIREVKEETGLKLESMEHRGLLNFADESGVNFAVHIFSSGKFSGEPQDSKEGKLQWFSLEELPYEEMWEDDRLWLPRLLKGEKVVGHFLFSKGFKKMLEHHLEEV